MDSEKSMLYTYRGLVHCECTVLYHLIKYMIGQYPCRCIEQNHLEQLFCIYLLGRRVAFCEGVSENLKTPHTALGFMSCLARQMSDCYKFKFL